MTDTSTHQRLDVISDDVAGPYLSVPFSQLGELESLLNRHGIRHWVEENIISLDGGPEIATVNFGRNGDAAAVQLVLDSVL